MKRMRQSERIERDVRDRLSDLPDLVLLHIMKFMHIKDAVQTCLLSKRWKELWKHLTNLTLDSTDFSSFPFFDKFMSSVLSGRDNSVSLHNLDLWHLGIGPRLLNRFTRYAASHDVQQLMINASLNLKKDFELPSCIFYCRSLTFLDLSFAFSRTRGNKIKLPKSLDLPALKTLYLDHVTFTTSDNGCAEPFSTCNMLNTLAIQFCCLQSDAKVLCISNSKLFSLTIMSVHASEKAYKITLSTPNLSLLTISGYIVHQLSSTCNITCLEEVNVHCCGLSETTDLVLISCLQVLVNVKIMTLSWLAFELLNALLSRGSIRTQLPCFVRLKSLKLKMDPYANISDEGISRMVEYLLQNSPLTRVDILKC